MVLSQNERMVQIENVSVLAGWLSFEDAINPNCSCVNELTMLINELFELPSHYPKCGCEYIVALRRKLELISYQDDIAHEIDEEHPSALRFECHANIQNIILFLSRIEK